VTLAGLVLVSFAPGLFWLWLYLRQSRIRPSPKRLVALAFLSGMISTIPAGIINMLALDESLFVDGASLTTFAIAMLIVVGPVEESSKFLAVRLSVYRSSYFQEPMDGLVYAAAASLGFASIENLLYAYQLGAEVMIVRGPLSTVAHLTFGSIWGYGLGLHQRSGRNRAGLVLVTLIAAAALHAAFNITAFSDYPWAAIAIVVLGGVWAFRRFEWGQRISPFRYRRNYPLVACASCNEQIRVVSRFCPRCGVTVETRPSPLTCARCKHVNRAGALYCENCGDRFLLR
jgi:RsiW-degrading membrane proteinase PrsW (M82 family)